MAHSRLMLYALCPTSPYSRSDVQLANGTAEGRDNGWPVWSLDNPPDWSSYSDDDYLLLHEPRADWSQVVLPPTLEADVYEVTAGRRFQWSIIGIVRAKLLLGFKGGRGVPVVSGQPTTGRLLGAVVPPPLRAERALYELLPEDSYWGGQQLENEGQLAAAKNLYASLAQEGNWSEHRYMALRRLAAMCCDSREESQRLWLEAIRLCPGRREAYIELAENYELNKEFHLARVMGEAALRCRDEDQVGWIVDTESKLRAHDTMSVICSRMGEYERAMEHGRIAVELGEQRIRNNLAYWHKKLDEAESARAATPAAEVSSSLGTGPTGSPSP